MLDDGRENEHTEDLEGHLTTSDGHSTRVANGIFFFSVHKSKTIVLERMKCLLILGNLRRNTAVCW